MRTFLAVTLGEGLRTQVAQIQQNLKQRLQRDTTSDGRLAWVHVPSIHLTLKFLGETEVQCITPLYDSMAQQLRLYQAVPIPLERLGVFPQAHQPRVLWLGPAAPWGQSAEARQLAALQSGIEACCETVGFPCDSKAFSPHVTLARVKGDPRYAGQMLAQSGVLEETLTLEPLRVDSVLLMQSTLRPTGAVYTTLWEIALPTA
ncbi:MAG: RNA 2',3'-cyclic phosphodiesterase [Candidatus Tectimicrobiota bacterium]